MTDPTASPKPGQHPAWELREPTDEQPDVGLNWLARNTGILRGRHGKPHLKAIAEAAGVSFTVLYAIAPERKGASDYRSPNGYTIGRLALLGSHVNGVTTKHAHDMLFCLPASAEAITELKARLAAVEANANANAGDRVAA